MFPIDIDFSRLKEVLTYDPQAPMIFSSGIFLWLFAAFMIVYTLLQRKYTARILFVTLFSYYFYYKSSGTYFFLLALVTVCDFLLAQWVGDSEFGSQSGTSCLLQIYQFFGRSDCLVDGRRIYGA